MTAFLFSHEATLRLLVFMTIFMLCAWAEAIRPRRPRMQPRLQRWFTNLTMLALATLLVRALAALAPLIGAMAAADFAAQKGWGLFNQTGWPIWLEVMFAVIVLDLAIWAQHLATHHIPLLWRLHRVHHCDRDLDASSALRFHPLEIALSALLKVMVVTALGASIGAVLLFEVVLNASAMFNHANMRLPQWLDGLLRLVVVTPDMHRVHHSIHRAEHDRNFGFCLSLWDRLFGTYKPQPDAGQLGMTIGLEEWQDDRPSRLGWAIRLPFHRD